MGCGGSKQQTKVISLQGSKDNVSNNQRSRHGSSNATTSNKERASVALQNNKRDDNDSVRSKQRQDQVEETLVQSFTPEEDEEVIRPTDVDKENETELIQQNASNTTPENVMGKDATPVQINDGTSLLNECDIAKETPHENQEPAPQNGGKDEHDTQTEELQEIEGTMDVEPTSTGEILNMDNENEDALNKDNNQAANENFHSGSQILIDHEVDNNASLIGENEINKEHPNGHDTAHANIAKGQTTPVETESSYVGSTLDVSRFENSIIEVADSGVDEGCHKEGRLTPDSKTEEDAFVPVLRTSHEKRENDIITIDSEPAEKNLQQIEDIELDTNNEQANPIGPLMNDNIDEVNSNDHVTSVTATAVAVLEELVTDVEITTTTSAVIGEMVEALDAADETSQQMKCSDADVFPNEVICAQNGESEEFAESDPMQEINDLDPVDLESIRAAGSISSSKSDISGGNMVLEVNNNGEDPIQVISNDNKAPEMTSQEEEETIDTDDQIKFNQAIRGYCRLVDPDALKTIATPGVTELCLERALPCIRDVFTHILANIGNLKVLNLSGNHIGPQSFRAVALALTNNKTLKFLNLSNNKTDTQCSESLGIMLANNDTLEELDLSSNQLGRDYFSRCVGPSMTTNSTLKVLRCASCGFADLSTLIDSLSANSTITELDFSHNHIVNGTEFGEKLAVLILNSTTLTTLNVKVTNISAEGMQKVRSSLQENTALTNLNIGGNQMLHCNAMLQLLVTCIHHAGLRDLSMQDTTYKEVHKIFDDVTTNHVGKSNLTHLNLSNCGLIDSLIQTLLSLMPGCLSALEMLNVANNSELTSDCIKDFAHLTSDGSGNHLRQLVYALNEAENLPFAMSHFQCLSSLDLRKCQIATSNLVQMTFFLNKPDGISSLCLDGQKLSGSDVLQVILSSGQDNSIESLSLIGCALNDEDLEPITISLRAGLGLKSLKLSANRITDRSIIEIVEALLSQERCVIEYINVANNKISCEGASQMSRLLSSCSTLHTLLAASNSIGSDGLRAIVGSVRPDSALKLLDLKGQANPIDEEDMEEILAVLAHALGYTVDKNEYGQVSMSTNPLVTVNQDLTVLLTNLGSMTGEVGRALDGSAVRTDYGKDHWPYLGLQEVLTLSAVLKGQSPAEKVSLTKDEWNVIIGEGKDPCIPSWLQIDKHRDSAVYLAGLPASVSTNRIEGDLDSEADCVIAEVCIMKDPILQKPNGFCWILMADRDSVEKAVGLYESGQARLFNQPYIISRLDVLITDAESAGLEDRAHEEMERRAKQRDAEDEEHRALLETSFAASKARHEYAAANPAYADGKIW